MAAENGHNNGVTSSTSPTDNIPGLEGVSKEMRAKYLANYQRHAVGISMNDMVDKYNDWAEQGKYDNDISADLYRGPMIVQDFVEKYLGDGKRTQMILDVAAGTGYVGEQLKKKGYTNIDALEPSSGMRAKAAQKAVYTTFYKDLLSEERSSVPENKYDVLVLSGGMGEGHVPCGALWEMQKVVKPGGVVIIVMREEYLSYVKDYKGKLEALMQQMEDMGLWSLTERTVVPQYSFNKNGIVFVLTVKK